MRVLELFCGIGGCAAALADRATVVAAVDINQRALDVYRANFSHPVFTCSIESLSSDWFRQWEADLWWLSPPCQPYTYRGHRRDLDDPRAGSLLAVLDKIRAIRPARLVLENVPGFVGSQAHQLLRRTLSAAGYHVQELLLCPTQLGIPNRRRRYYLAASQSAQELSRPAGLGTREAEQFTCPTNICLQQILDPPAARELWVDPKTIEQYRNALHLVNFRNPLAITACFTAAYGRSLVRSGSYLIANSGVRRFSPREILRLFGFPDSFRLPSEMPAKKSWPLIGNSLSIPVVRRVTSQFEAWQQKR